MDEKHGDSDDEKYIVSYQPSGYNFMIAITVGINCILTVGTLTLVIVIAVYLYLHADKLSSLK